MTLSEAQAIGAELVEVMRPYCARIEIGGSIRREKPENIKDIEIVCIPRWDTVEGVATSKPASLFDFEDAPPAPVLINRLHEWATPPAPLDDALPLRWIKTGTPDIINWTPKADGKYWRALHKRSGCKVDVFITTPERWGAVFLIRTGSAEFATAVLGHALRRGYRFQQGAFCRTQPDGSYEPLSTPQEEDIFRTLGLETPPPPTRTDASALRRSR